MGRVPGGRVACGQNSGHWIMKSGFWLREGRTTCFSGGQGPGKVGGVQRAGRQRVGSGSPTRFWKGALGTHLLAQPDPCGGRRARERRREERARRGRRRCPAVQESGPCGAEGSGGGSSPGLPTSSRAQGLRRPGRERPSPSRSRLAVPGRDSAARAGLAGSRAPRWVGGEPTPRGRGGARSPAACRGPARRVRALRLPGLEVWALAQGKPVQAWG